MLKTHCQNHTQVTDVDPSLQPDQLRIEPYHMQQYLGQPQWNKFLWTFTKVRLYALHALYACMLTSAC